MMNTYNNLVEKCFNECVTSFRTKAGNSRMLLWCILLSLATDHGVIATLAGSSNVSFRGALMFVSKFNDG